MLLESILRHVFLLIWNVLWHACRGELEQRRDKVEAAMHAAGVNFAPCFPSHLECLVACV